MLFHLSETEKQEKKTPKHLLWAGLMTLISIIILVFFLSYFFSHEIQFVSQWLLENIGFFALVVLVFISDSIISPVPPDAVLLIIATSALADHWLFYVGIISISSLLAGYFAWGLGRLVSQSPRMPVFMQKISLEHKENIKKYGTWAVVMGALTPLPFSLTCWSAGIVKMDLKTFSLGAITRVPRVFVYYWIIKATQISAELSH